MYRSKPVIAPKCLGIVTHSYAAPFSRKTCFDKTMEVLKRRRSNSEKQPCFSNYFLQLESRKKGA